MDKNTCDLKYLVVKPEQLTTNIDTEVRAIMLLLSKAFEDKDYNITHNGNGMRILLSQVRASPGAVDKITALYKNDWKNVVFKSDYDTVRSNDYWIVLEVNNNEH